MSEAVKWTKKFMNRVTHCIVSTIITGDPHEMYITDPEGNKLKIRSYLNHQFCVKTDISLQSRKAIWDIIGNTIAEALKELAE